MEKQAKVPKRSQKGQRAETRRLFLDRLRSEGRIAEWNTEVMALEKENPKFPRSTVALMVQKKLGCLGYVEEKRLAQLAKEKAAEAAKVRIMDDFEKAVAGLPDRAPQAVNLDWISAHPAMARKSRQSSRDNMNEILLTADDVLRAPHGPAPSKAAVYALQHWANHPADFFKAVLSEQKKKTKEGGSSEGVVEEDVGLDEIERMLEEMR